MKAIRLQFLHTKLLLVSIFLASCLLVAEVALAGKSADSSKTSPSQPASVSAMPRIGLDSGDVMDAPALNNAQATGARTMRMTVAWSAIEPQNTDPTHYNWTSTDSRLQEVASHGLSPLIVILGCPSWACVTDSGPLNNNMNAEVAEFMGAMAARYHLAPYNAHYWEMWNEPDAAGGPNRQWGWGMHPDKYSQMLAAVYPVIKAADPDSVVMSGGIAFDNWFNQGGPFNPDFLPDLLTYNGARYMDALAFHYYRNNNNGWTNIGLKIVQIRGILTAHGVNLPMICTESGLTSSTNYGSSEAIQARYMVQMNVYSAANGVQTTVWYLNRDFVAREPGWEVFALSGLTHLDNSPKPSFTAMQVFSQEIGSGVFLRRLGTSDGVTGTLEGYRFRGMDSATRQTSVVWNNATGTTTLTIPATQAPELTGAVSLSGHTVTTQPGPNGAVLVSVGSDPVYLRWRSPRFADVPFDSWMYAYVEYLASRGYVSGYTDGTFRPGNSSTRGQFSKMIVLGMGWPINTTGGPHFADVPQTQTYYTYIETAYNRGIINGYSCGGGDPCPGFYFHPMANITRSQITKLVVLAKGWTLLTPDRATFSDVAVGSAFFAFVETAVSHQVVSGYSDGTFRPGNNATRGQLSKMLAVALQQP